MRWTLALLALLPLAACAGKHPRPTGLAATWRATASPADRERIRVWRDTWEKATIKATPAHAAEIAAAGATLQPDAALGDPAPPPNRYRCRFYKVGALTPENSDFATTGPVACRVTDDEGQLHFSVQEGPQRPNGLLYAATDRRLVFLGAMVLSDETKSMHYGTDSERNLAGFVERIGANRWRLVLPSPRWEAMLEVIDLVPEG